MWKREISPAGSIAFAFVFTGDGTPQKISVALKTLGLTNSKGYDVTEVFDGVHIGQFQPDQTVSALVNPSGGIFLATATPLS